MYSSHRWSHRACCEVKKAPQKQLKGAAKRGQRGRKKYNRKQAQTYAQIHKYSTHDLHSKNHKNKQKQTSQNAQHHTSVCISRSHEKSKEKTPQNSQKEQNNTDKTKARKQTVKTTTLFVLPEPLQMEKKNRDNVKNSVKIFAHNK